MSWISSIFGWLLNSNKHEIEREALNDGSDMHEVALEVTGDGDGSGENEQESETWTDEGDDDDDDDDGDNLDDEEIEEPEQHVIMDYDGCEQATRKRKHRECNRVSMKKSTIRKIRRLSH